MPTPLPDLKLGIIGMDTSHSTAFTALLNNSGTGPRVPGARIVAAVKTFSPDVAVSANRVEAFTSEMRDKWGVKIVPTIEELCSMVDGVLVESVDGRVHLEQARVVIDAKKQLFVDKPMAATRRDVATVFQLAREAGVPIFSSSAYRFNESLLEVKRAKIGEIRSAISYGPAHSEPHHPDLVWYGIHPTEALFTVMGRGCQSVVRTASADADVVTGTWSGDRVGVLLGIRTTPLSHKVTVFGKEGFAEEHPGELDYAPLVAQIVKFFRSGIPPVTEEETLEIFAFLEAANLSKARGGIPVSLSEVEKSTAA